MNHWRINKIHLDLKIVLFFCLLLLSLGFIAFINNQKADALPVCLNDAGRRANARTPTTTFPRAGVSVNTSAGCAQVADSEQWVLLSSYYHDGTGAPGSTLHTPTATFRILAPSQPTSAVTVSIVKDTGGSSRCDYTSGSDVVVANTSGGVYGTLDSTNFVNITVPASEFVLAEEFGQGMYTWNRQVLVSANAATSVHCRVRAGVWLVGGYVVLREDGNPQSAYGEPNQRYNQTNAGTGAGAKQRLGPTSGSNGAIALYSTRPGTEVLEYALPFKMRCDLTTARDISIRWYDSDSTSGGGNASGTGQPAGDMFVAVYRESDGANVLDQRITVGNDVYGEVRLNILPDTIYTIVYYNVNARNGVQVWMPYSEIAAANGVNCANDPPPSCTLTNSSIVSLSWTSTDATSISINQGIGGVTPVASGTLTRALTASTTYTATVTGPGGTNTCQTTTPGVPVVPNITCPSYPPYASFSNPNVTQNLPITGKPGNTYSAPYGGSTISWGTWSGSDTSQSRTLTQQAFVTYTYYVYISTQPQPKTEVDSVVSSIIGGNPANVNVDFYDDFDSDGTAELNYTSLATNYPYDPATPTISYRVRYERRQVTQVVYRSRTDSRSRPNSTAAWTTTTGFFPAWPVSGSNVGGTDISTGFFWTANQSVNATQLPPCYPRRYNVNPTAGAAAFTGSRESPTGSTFSFTLPTVLSINNGGAPRTPTIVNGISYTVNYTTEGYSNPTFGGSYNRSVNITNSSISNNVTGTHSPSPLSESVNVTIPTIQAGDRICWTVTVSLPNGFVGAGSIYGTKLTAAPYPQTGPAETTTPPTCTPLVVDQPYSRFYGADLFAGGGYENLDETCTATAANAGLRGAMRDDQLSGTGTQLAAFALGQIDRIQPLSLTTRNPLQLAFANSSTSATVNPASRLYGGGFGSVACVNNYFSSIPSSTNWDTTVNNLDLSNLQSGKYYLDGDVNIFGQIPDVVDVNGIGRRIVVYVRNGDATIRMNSSGTGPAGKVGYVNSNIWPTLQAVPSLYIIVEGNIFIDNDVNEIDGVLIAQPSAANPTNTGEIETCNTNGTTLIPTASNVGTVSIDCRNQLRVNGSMIAKQIHHLRSLGSLRESVPREGFAITRAAESVIYNPALWFSSTQLPAEEDMQIDSYVQLPPAL